MMTTRDTLAWAFIIMKKRVRGKLMNTLITKSIFASAIAISVVACGSSGGGGGDLAGIGGSGFVSSGSITGFGSVFVNGVEFETDSATFDIEGVSGLQSDLAIGMVVKVDGTINNDGITGIASNISFNDELQGPVAAPPGEADIVYDVDRVSATFFVFGTKIVIDSSATSFDVDDGVSLPLNAVFDFDTIALNNNVEISGFFDANGVIQATRIELKDINFDPDSEVEIKGNIINLSGFIFNIGSLRIDATNAVPKDLPNGLQNGQQVEVKGTYDVASNTVIASKVEADDDGAEDTDEFEVEGIITNYDSSNDTFTVSGIAVDASSLNLTAGTLMNNLLIEVDGSISNGVLIAEKIELKGGDIKVHANVSSSNQSTNSFEVEPLPGQPTITVTINSSTQIDGDGIENVGQALTKLFGTPGFVEVRGLDDGSDGIIALEIDIKGDVDKVQVQGFATAADGDSTNGTMTVLGVTFNFVSATDFEIDSDVEGVDDTNMLPGQVNTLIADIRAGITPQLVNIEDEEVGKGDNIIGTADGIEVKSP